MRWTISSSMKACICRHTPSNNICSKLIRNKSRQQVKKKKRLLILKHLVYWPIVNLNKFLNFLFAPQPTAFFPMKSGSSHRSPLELPPLYDGQAGLVSLRPQCCWPLPWIRALSRWLLLPEAVFKRQQLPCGWRYSRAVLRELSRPRSLPRNANTKFHFICPTVDCRKLL